jgi:hypothetical protein
MALKSVPTSALRAEIARRERGAAKLQKKHSMLTRVLASLEAELAGLGVPGMKRRGRPPGSKNKRRGPKAGRRAGRRGRKPGRKPGRAGRKLPKNKQSLGDALAAAIRPGTVVSPAEAMTRVKAAGYKSTAKNFGVVVAIRLANDKRFRRKGRGQYERIAA